MDFKDLEQKIPQTEPDIQIGPLSIWISEQVSASTDTDYVYLNAPSLLKFDDIIIFSQKSDIAGFSLKNLKKGLTDMYENIGSEKIVETGFNDSEFELKFKSDLQGHIKIEILYRSWTNGGSLNFEDTIDQSYLPQIIKDIDSIIEKYL